MPSFTIPTRRRRGLLSEDDDEDGASSLRSSTPASVASGSSKRARLNRNGDASLSPRDFDRPDDSFTERNGHSEYEGAQPEEQQHQPGSIVRVKLSNFVTYTSAEFHPGPSLNMIIGPNGTGKSTLVCAICLGLGWGPQHLGRAKEIGEFVKHGCREAIIEIELARDPERQELNPVIRRRIVREGNKSNFFLNGKATSQKGVLELAKSFSIQVDNLCQFLPQDKVCEFAALSPVDLLQSTLRAAAPEHMLQWHDDLKVFRSEQKKLQGQHAADKEQLANLQGRQEMVRGDVERFRERVDVEKKVAMLELARPFAKYREARKRNIEAKQKKKEALAELKNLESAVGPLLRAVNAKQEYRDLVEKALKSRKRDLEKADLATDKLLDRQKAMDDDLKTFEREIDLEKKEDISIRKEVLRIDGLIKDLKRQMANEPEQLDVGFYNDQIHEKSRLMREIKEKIDSIKGDQKTLITQADQKKARITQAQKDLENLDSQAGQQGTKLRNASRDTALAWEWIQKNQDKFEKRVYGPPIVECSIKDPKYIDALESLFQRGDFVTITCQTKADFKLLTHRLYKEMRLADVTIRNSSKPLDDYHPPVSEPEMRRYGFDGWALDYIAGPNPVLAMLCGDVNLHRTGVCLRDINDQQFEALQTSPIANWVTSKNSYSITRRREYGPGAVSTRVREVRRGNFWTNKPVDIRAKAELQDNISGWGEELQEFYRQFKEGQNKIDEFKEEAQMVLDEKKQLEDEKGKKQLAIGRFKALPAKLAQEEAKLETRKNALVERKDRIKQLVSQIDDVTLQKGNVVLEYAAAVETLRVLHFDLLEAETALIEANSELEELTQRNQTIKDSLEASRREVQNIVRESEESNKTARALMDECQRILQDKNRSPEQDVFLSALPEGQTEEELEAEIESEKARLELLHQDNPNLIRDYEHRQKQVDNIQERVAKAEDTLADLSNGISEIRQKWEPELDVLIKSISDAFSYSFEKIGCAGEVGVHKDEDFDQWSVEIQVKFRESEQLSILDSHRQSGGERAVSTIFYLMALQSLAKAPFRVVDEINQGMDPRNERMVHERMVDIACLERTSQYFLITPKLLHSLKYHPRMNIHCIASGEYMPDNYLQLDHERVLQTQLAIRAMG